ncbi:MAG: PDZ domain-containing protein, partial [Leptolyngbya sp. SIO4C1]|nr:PDZ domain-containing protein [Leptolyngbya sp. SIO4C1]
FDIPNDTQGLVVMEAVMGGPASRAGIESADFAEEITNARAVPESVDVITAIDGQPISGISELIGYLASETSPGQTVTLDVLRLSDDGIDEMQFEVTVTPRP